ncbi:MAG TPA: T9SS type A sorting domain-containing protein [Chitinophagales bacterium]|nr:T9SS type A sorting domain-containing protein [Chitinophagales bacterium]
MKKTTHCFILAWFVFSTAQGQQSSSNKTYFEIRDQWLHQLQEKNKTSEQPTGEEFENDYTQFNRWQWFWEPRVGPSGKMINPTWLDLLGELQLEKQSDTRSATSGDWISCGPNHITCGGSLTCVNPGIGRVNCLAYNGFNLYAGTASGGAWVNIFGVWYCLTNSIPNLTVSGICVDYNNTNNIYLLTGDGESGNLPDGQSNTGTNSMGVLKSTDGGTSWNTTPLVFDITSTSFFGLKMIMHPSDPAILFVVSNQGIHKTTNGGATWTTVRSAMANETFFDIEFKPGDPTTMYAASNLGFYRSTNTGDNNTWSAISLPFTINLSDPTRLAIGVSPANSSTVYLLVGKQSMGYVGLFKSTNNGVSFGSSALSTTPNVIADEPSGTRWQLFYDFVIAVDPTNINNVYAGGIDFYKSTDGGVTFNQFSDWNNVSPGSIHADQHDFIFDPFFNIITVANDGGVYENGGGWSGLLDGLDITQFRGIGLDKTSSFNNSILGGQDNGEMVYDGDDNFQEIYTGDGGDAVVDFTDHDRYYFIGNGQVKKQSCGACVIGGISPYAGCLCHDDSLNINGSDWTPAPLVMSDANHSEIYVGFTCMFKSTNEGGSWSLVPGLPCGGNAYVSYAHGSSNDWAAKGAAVFHQTSPTTWANRTGTLPVDSTYITRIIVSPSNDDVAWVTCSGYKAGKKVYVTTNGGTSWTNISGSLPNVPVNCIVRQSGSNDGLYIGTDIGVFYRDNIVGDWIPFRNAMPSAIVTDLEISSVDGNIYATTYGRGLWKSHLVNPCEPSIALPMANALPAYSSFESAIDIISQENASAGLGQSLNYKAGSLVDLLPGFAVTNGSTFHGYIGSCSPVSPRFSSNDGYYAGPMPPGSDTSFTSDDANSLKISIAPNPASDLLDVTFMIREKNYVTLSVTDLGGRVIRNFLLSQYEDSGEHSSQWKINDLPDGTYLIVLKSGTGKRIEKLVVIH